MVRAVALAPVGSGGMTSPPTADAILTWAEALPLTVPNWPAEASSTVAVSTVTLWLVDFSALKVSWILMAEPGGRLPAPVRSFQSRVPVVSSTASGVGVVDS